MTIITTLTGATFTNSLGRLGVCDPAATQAITLLGDAGKNAFEVVNKPVYRVNGIPTYNDNYASFNATAEVDSGQLLDTAFTLLAVFRPGTTGIKIPVSSMATGQTTSYFGWVSGNPNLSFAYKTGASATSLATQNGYRGIATFGFYCARISGAGLLDLWSAAAGLLTKQPAASNAGAFFPAAVANLKINSLTGGFTGTPDVAYLALYKSQLTDAQVQAQYDKLRAFFDPKLPNTL